jgi:hypothetical protein
MTHDETLEQLVTLRRLARAIQDGTDNPSVERSMAMVELYCHLAQWNLGADIDMIPAVETLT